MASINDNIRVWNDPKSWKKFNFGEDWSKEFGSTEVLWFSYLYPRIVKFIENSDILEIAPGTGRITKYLMQHCNNYFGYDVSEFCVDYCTKEYGNFFAKNDGKSLSHPDSSVDFIFSWDSLVHCDQEVLADYAKESIRCLKSDGVAFIHHSNYLGSNCEDNPHWRGLSSAKEFKKDIESIGGYVIIQEFINWDDSNRDYSDCITVFSKNKISDYLAANNPLFYLMRSEAKNILSSYLSIK